CATVTGVQTCALPILIGVRFRYWKLLCNGCATAASASTTGIQPVAQPRARATAQPKQTTFKNAQQALETSGLQRATRAKGTSPRSEERRVGTGCRAEW